MYQIRHGKQNKEKYDIKSNLEPHEAGPLDEILIRLRNLEMYCESLAERGTIKPLQALVPLIWAFFRIVCALLVFWVIDPFVKQIPNVLVCAVEEFVFKTSL